MWSAMVHEAGWLAQSGPKIRTESAKSIAEVEKSVTDVATGSIRMEMLGLLLIGLGTIVAAIPTLCGWH
jgi:hypothetical protein